MKITSKTNRSSAAMAQAYLAAILSVSLAGCSGQGDAGYPESDLIVLSVVGTNDVHGELLPKNNKGGLTTFSGYITALRSAREEDGGAVLLIDAGGQISLTRGPIEIRSGFGLSIIERNLVGLDFKAGAALQKFPSASTPGYNYRSQV